MIKGNKVFLRLMEEDDIPIKVEWVNDEEIRTFLISDYISETGTRLWLRNAHKSNRREFVICLNQAAEPIGFTSLKNIDLVNSKAEMSMLLGNKKYWGKGLARQARYLLLNYAFHEIGLNKVYTFNWEENERIISLNKALGFVVEGELRDDIYFRGSHRTVLIMGILRSDWIRNTSNSHILS